MSGPARRPIAERIMGKFLVGDGCWEWTASRAPSGYGQISSGGHSARPLRAHRVVYETLVGPIPANALLCHQCDNPGCVRPDHMFIGTQHDNMRDASDKGRLTFARPWAAENAPRKTHCPQGHPYSGENLYVNPQGHRVCRTCSRQHSLAYERRKQGHS